MPAAVDVGRAGRALGTATDGLEEGIEDAERLVGTAGSEAVDNCVNLLGNLRPSGLALLGSGVAHDRDDLRGGELGVGCLLGARLSPDNVSGADEGVSDGRADEASSSALHSSPVTTYRWHRGRGPSC